MRKQKEQPYKGWMTSQSLIKRSFGVFGHVLLAQLLLGGVIFIIALLFDVM